MYVMPGGEILSYKQFTPQIASGVFVASGAKVIGKVILGESVNVWFNTVIRGDVHNIEIGAGTNIQDNSTVHVTKDTGPVRIGQHVTIGHNTIIHACTIADYALIGMGSVILDGAFIPERCLVGAGSVVTAGHNFEPGYLIIGSPARPIRKLKDSEWNFLEISAANYVKLARDYQ